MKPKTAFLSEVAIIRPILIFLLVFYHAFAIYSGAWAPIKGYPEVPAYWWLDKLSYAFMLEMFVFISGYVFGFQVRTKGNEKLKAKNLLWGKFKRLMLPCMVFSLLYILLFGNITQPVQKTVYDLLNGVGHMWFLPMLFWCFVGVWVIEKLQLKAKWIIPVLVMCSICSFLPLPLRMGTAMYYMLFFYLGYIIEKEDVSLDRFYTLKHCIILIITFCILFPTFTLLKEKVGSATVWVADEQLIIKVINLSLSKLLQIIYSFVGLAMLFVFVGYKERDMKGEIPQWLIKLGGLCFGVYLLQQFILNGLYNYTELPVILGCYWLPWVGFILATTFSLVLTLLIRKTKIGRKFL